MDFYPTLTSAIAFSEAGRLEDWIHAFLLGEGDNRAFSDGLRKKDRIYYPPVKLPLDQFERSCGPEEGMPYPVEEGGFWSRIQRIQDRFLNTGWDMPPLIANIDTDVFVLNDGNHRYEALRQLGINSYWVIRWKS